MTGRDTVNCGQDVEFTATPTSVNNEVKSWSWDDCDDGETTCTVTTSTSMRSVTVTATFEKKECTVTGMAIGPGTVTPARTHRGLR